MTITYRWPKDDEYIHKHFDPMSLRRNSAYQLGRQGFATGAERYPGPNNPAITSMLKDRQVEFQAGLITGNDAYVLSRDIVNAWVLGWDEACADSYHYRMEWKRVDNAQ